jgi:hypothetical protein
MWQVQYLRALDVAAERVAEADRERLAHSASRRPAGHGTSLARRAISLGTRSIRRGAPAGR